MLSKMPTNIFRNRHNSIRKIVDGQKIGTFFTHATPDATPVDIMAKNGEFSPLFSSFGAISPYIK